MIYPKTWIKKHNKNNKLQQQQKITTMEMVFLYPLSGAMPEYICPNTSFLFQLPLVQIDQYYYGKMVVAPLNIVLYNVFTEHGPDLYGK